MLWSTLAWELVVQVVEAEQEVEQGQGLALVEALVQVAQVCALALDEVQVALGQEATEQGLVERQCCPLGPP